MSETLANNAADSVERREEAFKSPAALHTFWMNQLSVASKEEEGWRHMGDKAVKLYKADKSEPSAFNILHSNVETIIPALYNSTPVPDIRPRNNSQDEIARRGAQAIELALSFQLDEYDFDAVAIAAVRDMQSAGRGVARVRYRPYVRTDQNNQEQVVWEEAACEHVPWRSFRRGPGTMWSEVPWIAYEQFLTRDELVKLAGPEVGNEVALDATIEPASEDSKTREKTAFKKARVWEIWDKDTRKLYFVAPGYEKGPLTVAPDPLGFLDFFDCPSPLQAITDPDKLVPVTPYEVYRKQAEELNQVSERIIALVRVCKFRGIRASEIIELEGLEDLDDGQFAPSSGAMATLGGGTALDDAIWVVPIDKLIAVIRELVVQREQIKQVIYEITGIADILRGAADPGETLGAQQIKAQWGSLRIQRQQAAVQRFCRDIFRLKAEIIANRFSPETLAMMVGEPLPEPVLQVLRSDVRRTYMIDVETDSTIRGDLTRAQQNMSNFMTATAQFFQTFVPLLQSGQLPPQVGQAAITVYAAFARQFKLGKQVDDTLAKLAQAAEQMPIGQPTPEAKAKQQDAEQISRAGAVAEVRKTEAEAAKAEGEAVAQQVETAVMATTGGPAGPGFVQ